MQRRSVLVIALALSVPSAFSSAQVGTTATDFDQPGSQPGDLVDPIQHSLSCAACHAGFDEVTEPYERWSGNMMANSTRDPVFHAALAIANQDMTDIGTWCIRCHTPQGFVNGNALPADGSSLTADDYDGINCHTCHRFVDPIADAANPAVDPGIIAALASAPTTPHNAQIIFDPFDRRRGPFDLGPSFFLHDWLESPFHQESLLCASCHEVSNPAYTRNGGPVPAATDTYDLNTANAEHPTHDKLDEFPEQRTYTEWALSDFGAGPVDMGGLFGGNLQLVSSCQDCHMPDVTGGACAPPFSPTIRTDLPQHNMHGANSWVPRAIYSLDQSLALYPASHVNGQPLSVFEAAIDRNISMLERAAQLQLSIVGSDLNVRIVNRTGHKLPTGYPEGRRIWINVQFQDIQGHLIKEYGAYDMGTADLTTIDTKVYEAKIGPDANMAALTGEPAAASFHFAISNKLYLDNRIPPRGFANAAFEANQIQPVGATYADGQYWDDTLFPIPNQAEKALVRIYHQTSSKEYMEFLRDENSTNGAGLIAYNEWVAAGRSAPILMQQDVIPLVDPGVRGALTFSPLGFGQVQALTMDGGTDSAGAPYLVIGSTSGTSPGTHVAGFDLPLNFDGYTRLTLSRATDGLLENGSGLLDAEGRAQASFGVPLDAPLSLIGTEVTHAFLFGKPGQLTFTKPVTVVLEP